MKRIILAVISTLMILFGCIGFAACDGFSRPPEIISYKDKWNSVIWENVYDKLVNADGYASDYNLFRTACENLTGDAVALSGKEREGVRISSVSVKRVDMLDTYTLTLNDEAMTVRTFAVINTVPADSNASAFEIYKETYPEIDISESKFISRMSEGDMTTTIKLVLNGGSYVGASEFTDMLGFIYQPGTPNKGDDIFYGWYYDSNLTKKLLEDSVCVDENTVLYASWEEYDYAAVDYTLWDNLVASVTYNISRYYTDETNASLKAFAEEFEKVRGTITQVEVNDYINEYNYMLKNADFQKSDVIRIFVSTSNNIRKEWYVPAQFAVVNEEGGQAESFYDGYSQIRIRGNSTSLASKVGYNIKLSKKTSLFGMAKIKKWALLANAYDKTTMRNAIALNFGEQLGMDFVSDYKMCEVILNGTYLGSYMLVESVGVSEDRVDINLDNNDAMFELEMDYTRQKEDVTYFYTSHYGMCFGVEEPEVPTAKQVVSWVNILNTVELAIKSGDMNEIEKYINVDSFVQVYIANEYLKNVDVWMSSMRFYLKDGILYAGPIWDYDLSMGNADHTYYDDYCNYQYSEKSCTGAWATRHAWFADLMKCSDFFKLVADKYLEMQPVIISYYEGEGNFIDTFLNENWELLNRTYKPWSEGGANLQVDVALGKYEMRPLKTISANVEYLRTWLKNRNAWMLTYLHLD